MKLWEVSKLIRSKNAGPFELTFDIFFVNQESYERVKAADLINAQWVSSVYKVPPDQVRIMFYPCARAVKVTIPRRVASGDFFDSDVYGGQQHAPFVDLPLPTGLPAS